MTPPNLKLSDLEIEEFSEQFSRRYIQKKRVNAILCFFIACCGTSAVLYSRFVFGNALLDRLRYMTFWGTIYTSVVSLIFGIVCVMEAARETEVTSRKVYFVKTFFRNSGVRYIRGSNVWDDIFCSG